MGLNWRNLSDDVPYDGQWCLTKMKHGIIEGRYRADDAIFDGYYWTDLEWGADEWVPMEEVG